MTSLGGGGIFFARSGIPSGRARRLYPETGCPSLVALGRDRCVGWALPLALVALRAVRGVHRCPRGSLLVHHESGQSRPPPQQEGTGGLLRGRWRRRRRRRRWRRRAVGSALPGRTRLQGGPVGRGAGVAVPAVRYEWLLQPAPEASAHHPAQ